MELKQGGYMAENKTEDIGHYAARHPRRMYSTAFLVGVGAGLMASKMKKQDKTALQKVMDQFNF